MNTGKMIYGIIGLIITFMLLSGGLSGTLVLRGTNSSSALVVVALIFLVGDIAYIYSAYREGEVKSEPISSNEVNDVKPVVPLNSDNSVGAFQMGGGKTRMQFDKPHTIDENFKK